MAKTEITQLKVRKDTNPSRLAGALVKGIQNNETCEIIAIGAGPINQAMKAVAIANRLLGSSGVALMVQPCFTTLDLSKEAPKEGEQAKPEVTAIKFKVIVEK